MADCIRTCWIWFITLMVFLVGLALFIPGAFSAAWVYIPSNSSSTGDLSAGLWTDCNSTIYQCDNYNEAYLDASAALIIVATIGVFLSGLTQMLPWLSSIAQTVGGFFSLIAIIVFMQNNADLSTGYAVPLICIAMVVFVVNGVVSFVALGLPDIRRMSKESKLIKKDVKKCCTCNCCVKCGCCKNSNSVEPSQVEL